MNRSEQFVHYRSTVREGLDAINRLPGGSKTLFVVDDDGVLIGTLTDGDIRRGLLSGADMSDAVESVMFRRFRSIRQGDDIFAKAREAKLAGVELLPVTDDRGVVQRWIGLGDVEAILPLDVVLMAGGRGERLRPLTLHTPKPLLKVGSKAIIDRNVDNLRRFGIGRFFVTVNYLKEQIIGHFAARTDVEGICIAEPTRLGTLGSLALIHDWRFDNVLVMNSDLLTNCDLAAMYERHLATKADITIGAIPYNIGVPFALLQTEDDHVLGLKEKPSFNYLANAGVYIMKTSLVKRLLPGQYKDAPDFIEESIADGRKVSYFVIEGLWIDIGNPDDYRNACRLMDSN